MPRPHLRQIFQTWPQAVIALTGYTSPQDIQAAMQAGFQRHLVKPIDLEDLAEALYSLVQS